MTQPDSFHISAHTDIQSTLEIQRSRFITVLRRINSETEAREFIAHIRKQWPDARHHCSAFRYITHESGLVERSSDDGEPSGTAGRPMLDTLRSAHIINICAVVVRYFGGIKLGTGGLVRAYTTAVQGAIDKAELLIPVIRTLITCELPYDQAGKIESLLRNKGIEITSIDYSQTVVFTCAIDKDMITNMKESLSSSLGSHIEILIIGQSEVDIPFSHNC